MAHNDVVSRIKSAILSYPKHNYDCMNCDFIQNNLLQHKVQNFLLARSNLLESMLVG
jgi:hypothetical protein